MRTLWILAKKLHCETRRFDARGHTMEVEMFSTSIACLRAPQRTESLINYKFASPARAKLV